MKEEQLKEEDLKKIFRQMRKLASKLYEAGKINKSLCKEMKIAQKKLGW